MTTHTLHWHESLQPCEGFSDRALPGAPQVFVSDEVPPARGAFAPVNGATWLSLPWDAWQALGGPVRIEVEVRPA